MVLFRRAGLDALLQFRSGAAQLVNDLEQPGVAATSGISTWFHIQNLPSRPDRRPLPGIRRHVGY